MPTFTTPQDFENYVNDAITQAGLEDNAYHFKTRQQSPWEYWIHLNGDIAYSVEITFSESRWQLQGYPTGPELVELEAVDLDTLLDQLRHILESAIP